MKNKEAKLIINVALIFMSVLLIYGIFSPWITVATIYNVFGKRVLLIVILIL